jgi:hypothetical protein
MAVEPREELEVLPRRQPAVDGRPLGRPADGRAGLDDALARVEGAGEDRQQRRLAGAVRPDQRDELAHAQLEVAGSEHLAVAEAA